MYGCETWSLTLKEEHIEVVSSELWRLFGPKKHEVTLWWRRFIICILHLMLLVWHGRCM